MGDGRTYPMPRPDNDDRFRLSLVLDVAGVLQEHGYPPLVDGADLVALQQALFAFLYATAAPNRTTEGAANTDPRAVGISDGRDGLSSTEGTPPPEATPMTREESAAKWEKAANDAERTWCYPCGGSGLRYRGFKAGYVTCPDCGGTGASR